ncbi:MAG: uracil-DNA glycosylase [Acidobacteria bacterium]|nr:uracil-DNA glycosylase [Acidobacteriota bacterium]
MENPEKALSRELANWLKYYRQLGFTHLYLRGAGSSSGEESAASPASQAAVTELDQTRSASGRVSAEAEAPALIASSSLPTPARHARSRDLFAASSSGESLPTIQEDLGDCRRCKLWKGRTTIVFGSGNPKAELVFVGEGPGADEDRQGLPFVGRAGQLLTDMIEKGMGISRSEVYICNIVKCRPPENRKPEKDEIATCRQFVERQLEAIQPRVICALGATAAETLLGVRQSMASLRGRWHEFQGFPLLVSYHPAFLLRDPSKKRESWADLKMILAYLGSPRGSSPAASPGG